MRYKITAISDVNKRTNNEDAFFYKGININGVKYVVALVADGMGGLEKGELASILVKEEAEKFFVEENLTQDFEKLKRNIQKFVQIVDDKARYISNERDVSLGTTLTLLVLCEGKYLTVNIGDSRIYLLNDRVRLLTKDQTVFQKELDTGEVNNAMPIGKKKSTLLQCIGSGVIPIPVFTSGTYGNNDCFMLCSDGMYNRVNEREIASFKKGCMNDAREFLNGLSSLAKEKGERDNITGVFIEVNL